MEYAEFAILLQAAADGMHPPECEEPRSEVVVVPPMSKPADEPMTGGIP